MLLLLVDECRSCPKSNPESSASMRHLICSTDAIVMLLAHSASVFLFCTTARWAGNHARRVTQIKPTWKNVMRKSEM